MGLDLTLTYKIDSKGDLDKEDENITIDIHSHENYERSDLYITHNLGEMASNVKLGKYTLYDVLWRPYRLADIEDNTDEANEYTPIARELQKPVQEGLIKVQKMEKELKAFQPSNGFGTYLTLLEFCRKYSRALYRYPNALVQVSR